MTDLAYLRSLEATCRYDYGHAAGDAIKEATAEIERLTAALKEIADDDPCPARNIARRALGLDEQSLRKSEG